MNAPNTITQTRDERTNFTFRVRAYRQLTPGEMRVAFQVWNQQRDKRRSLRNKVVEIVSIIGYGE